MSQMSHLGVTPLIELISKHKGGFSVHCSLSITNLRVSCEQVPNCSVLLCLLVREILNKMGKMGKNVYFPVVDTVFQSNQVKN